MKQQTYSWEQAVKASYRALQDEKKCLIDIGLTSKMFGEVPESSLKRLEAVREKIRGWKQWFSTHYPSYQMTKTLNNAPVLSVEHGLLLADGKPVCTLIQLYTLFQRPVKLRNPLLFIDMGCAVNGEQSNPVP